MFVERFKPGVPGLCDGARNDSVEATTPRGAHPLSCGAQSQHPERSVERFTFGFPGFRDYARNDPVEPTTPRSAHPPCGAHHPVMRWTSPLSCCAQSQHPERLVEHSKPGVPGFRDYARNDSVEATMPRSAHPPRGAYHPVMLIRTTVSCYAHPPVMLRAVAASRKACRTI